MNKFNSYFIIGFFAVCGAILGYTAYNKHVEAEELRESLRRSENAYNRLSEETALKLDSIQAAKEAAILKNHKTIDSLSTLYTAQKNLNYKLQFQLDSILSTPPVGHGDSSYVYINTNYPPKTEQLYSLDTFQIKKFHQVDLGLKASQGLMASLYNSLSLADSLNLTLNSQVLEWKGLHGVLVKKYDMALADNKKYLIEIDGLEGDLRKQKVLKNIAGGGLILGAVAIIYNSVK